VLNVNKIKLFLQDSDSDLKTDLNDLNFNDFSSDMPLMRARAKFINYKNPAQLALIMLYEEGGTDYSEIDSLCNGPCASCDSESDYLKLNPPKRNSRIVKTLKSFSSN
jgi:hypothetical protein